MDCVCVCVVCLVRWACDGVFQLQRSADKCPDVGLPDQLQRRVLLHGRRLLVVCLLARQSRLQTHWKDQRMCLRSHLLADDGETWVGRCSSKPLTMIKKRQLFPGDSPNLCTTIKEVRCFTCRTTLATSVLWCTAMYIRWRLKFCWAWNWKKELLTTKTKRPPVWRLSSLFVYIRVWFGRNSGLVLAVTPPSLRGSWCTF